MKAQDAHYSLLKLTCAIVTALTIIAYNIGSVFFSGKPAIEPLNNALSLCVFAMLLLALHVIVKPANKYRDENDKPYVFLMMGALILGVSFLSTHIGLIFALFSNRSTPSAFSLLLLISVWGMLYFISEPMHDFIGQGKVKQPARFAKWGLNIAFLTFSYLMYKNNFSAEYIFYFSVVFLLEIGFMFFSLSMIFVNQHEGKVIYKR